LRQLTDYALINLISFAVQWSSVLILGMSAGSSDAGFFSTAQRLELIINFVLDFGDIGSGPVRQCCQRFGRDPS